jgi:hypothetical protein
MHDRASAPVGREVVDMMPPLERPELLLIDEALRTLVLAHAGGQAPPEAEMPGLEGDTIAEREPAGSRPVHHTLAGRGHGRRVDPDVQARVENTLRWRGDACGEFEA